MDVFITDLYLEEPTLSKLANDKKINNKIFLFDHHKSALEFNLNKYDFTTIKVYDENGLCSGTSLFYEYLISNNFIDSNKKIINEFVELTRQYDTWEWKTKYNNEMSHELTLLFDSIGCNGYIKLMYQKLLKNSKSQFYFNDIEKMLINNKKAQVQEKLATYIKKIHYKDVLGLKAGIIFINYEYRNDLAEYIRQNNIDIDFVMLVALDYSSISYRSIKDTINVRLIAEAMGGKGHDKAASSPISDEQKIKLIKILTKDNR